MEQLLLNVWIEADWNVDNDSGGGDGNQYAPEGFDPFTWANDGTSCEGDVVVKILVQEYLVRMDLNV